MLITDKGLLVFINSNCFTQEKSSIKYNSSSKQFVLTSIYLNADCWQENYNKIREFRKNLKKKYGLHIKEKIHTKHLVRDKGMYRSYGWNNDQRKQLLIDITKLISSLDIRVINVIIDKERIKNTDYPVLKNALLYNIQRIENDSAGKWHYLIITDEGRLAPMRKTAGEIRAFNPFQSHYGGYQNSPIKGLIEDIMAKESTESYFIQICDFSSRLLLVNFSGVHNPYTKVEYFTKYCSVIVELILKYADGIYDEIVFSMNSEVSQKLEEVFNNYEFKSKVLFGFFGHDDFVNLLCRADRVITNPGITATLELLSNDCAFAYLFGSNYSQCLMTHNYKVKNGLNNVFTLL